MLLNRYKCRILWITVSLFALAASLVGVADQSIYENVVSREVLPGVLSQDIITVIASIVLLFLTVSIKEENINGQMVILGILGYFFYGYGIFVIERIYNLLYFVYLIIFGLSFYSIIYTLVNIRKEALGNIYVSKRIRTGAVVFLLLQPAIFYPLWIAKLLPLIKSGEKVEYFYSIYILDLCIILPAFIITAVMAIRNKGFGLLLTPALCVKGFTLLFSVALGGFFAPYFGGEPDTFGIMLFGFLAILFLLVIIIYFRNFEVINNDVEIEI